MASAFVIFAARRWWAGDRRQCWSFCAACWRGRSTFDEVEGGERIMDWLLEGEWFKNCNCDPGCPCDFNQAPTQANCEGMLAMRVTSGHVDGVDLSGLCWAVAVWWPGRMDEGNGKMQLLIDESGTP